MQLQNRYKKILFIAIGLAALIIIAALMLRSPKKPTSGNNGTYIDPLSHETVSNPPGKAPDTYGANPNAPIYLGIDKLLDYGLSYNQLVNLKAAFYGYSKTQKQPIKEVSIDVDHIETHHDSKASGSSFTVLFNGRFDRQTDFKAKVEYFGLNDIRLYLMDFTSGKIIYDSGTITAQYAE